jgi:hypothetical protein
MINKINLDYDFSTILAADYKQHEGSCMVHQKRELDDIYQKYGGYPDTFNYDNTKIHQLWWDRTQVDYEEFGRQLNMEVIMVSSILQEPGCMIPLHRDTFFQINKNYPDRKETGTFYTVRRPSQYTLACRTRISMGQFDRTSQCQCWFTKQVYIADFWIFD